MTTGRELVESRVEITSQPLLLAMCEYHRAQIEYVQRHGCCEGGCSVDNLERTPHGKLVCFRTRDRCPRQYLVDVLARYMTLNRRTDR